MDSCPQKHFSNESNINKKVLLRKCKRHTALRVTSARYAVPVGGTPPPRPDLGPGGGYLHPADRGYHPVLTWEGGNTPPPPKSAGLGTPPPQSRCELTNWKLLAFWTPYEMVFNTLLLQNVKLYLMASKIFGNYCNATTNCNAAHFVYLVLNYASKDSTGESLDDVKEFLPKICKQCLKSLQENRVNSPFVFQKPFHNVSLKKSTR